MAAHTRPLATPSNSLINKLMSVTSKPFGKRRHVLETELAPVAPYSAGDETILVVEDDDDVRDYTTGILRELGYKVLEARRTPRLHHISSAAARELICCSPASACQAALMASAWQMPHASVALI
jgi:hypothetical protein